MRRYLAEFFGTMMIVGLGTGSIIYSLASSSSSPVLQTALMFALAYYVAMKMFYKVSGGHFNPAVSLAMAINKKLPWIDFGFYTVAQILGALAGSILVFCGSAGYLKSAAVSQVLSGQNIKFQQFIKLVGLGQTDFADGSQLAAFGFEFVLTFFLVMAFVMLMNKNDNNAFAVAMLFVPLYVVGFAVTGASLNPARAIAPAVMVQGTALMNLWVYVIAELLAGVVAAFIARFWIKAK